MIREVEAREYKEARYTLLEAFYLAHAWGSDELLDVIDQALLSENMDAMSEATRLASAAFDGEIVSERCADWRRRFAVGE
jgi:hypothetical protein